MLASTPNQNSILTVSELNRQARHLLEQHFATVTVTGELSGLSRPSSGHWYFTLKDDLAQIRCAMFRNRNLLVKMRPESGQQVQLRARLSLYEARGDYQLIVEQMEPAGIGALARAFALLKERLQQEGLFATDRKRPLPTAIGHIAVITSPTGAAVHDILSVLKRRAPDIAVSILPVAVQGEQASAQICNALALANRWQQEGSQSFDVILLSRGGGSLEDLWPFNEESVARAIAASTLPVISAVGHEVDVTIADFVADIRAATPSAAAELLSPDRQASRLALSRQYQRLQRSMQQQLAQARQQLVWVRRQLQHPGEKLQQHAQRLDELEQRLLRSWRFNRQEWQNTARQLESRLFRQTPRHDIVRYKDRFRVIYQQLGKTLQHRLQHYQQRVSHSAGLLDSLSPLQTLGRGYAIVRNDQQQLISNAAQVEKDQTVTIQLAVGELSARVTSSKLARNKSRDQ